MKKINKASCIIFLVTVIALGLISSADTASKEPVKIGLISVLSGPFAQAGNDVKNGIILAAEEKKTIWGRPIKLIIEDTQAKPEIGVRKDHATGLPAGVWPEIRIFREEMKT